MFYYRHRKALLTLFSNLLLVFIMLLIFTGCGGGGGGGSSSSSVDYNPASPEESTPQPTNEPTVTPEPSSGLKADTTYYWQVESCGKDGSKNIGPTWSFTTTSKNNEAFDGEITADIAKTVAKNHLRWSKSRSEILFRYYDTLANADEEKIDSVIELESNNNSQVLAYVINFDPTGYVVVPADKNLPPVLAYSWKNRFKTDDSDDNVLLKILKRDLQLRKKALNEKIVNKRTTLVNGVKWKKYIDNNLEYREDIGKVWGPLFAFTTWNQGAPYNNLCPVEPQSGKKTTAGCVAVSMAQVMNHWKYPLSVELTSSDNYTTNTYNIPIDAATASLSQIDYNNGNPDENTLASLCYAAGILVKTDYSSGGSGAEFYQSYLMLKNRLGYNEAVCDTYLDTGFDPVNLANEMKAGRPSVLCITSETNAHSINADGYDEATGTFHLSFGWGGENDGWYALPEGMPGYNFVEAAVIKLSPEQVVSSGVPENPYPPNSGNGVETDVTLRWSCLDGDYYNLYLWCPSTESKPSNPTASNLTDKFFKP